MDEELVQIEVERGGNLASVRKGVSPSEVAGLVVSFKGEPDVTLIIISEADEKRLLIAVSGAKAFVGLDEVAMESFSLSPATTTPTERSR
jgi:hypothetical protein